MSIIFQHNNVSHILNNAVNQDFVSEFLNFGNHQREITRTKLQDNKRN